MGGPALRSPRRPMRCVAALELVAFQRELLELAQQPLLALADLGHERLRGGARRARCPCARACARAQLAELPRLDRRLRDDLPARAFLTASCSAAGAFARSPRARTARASSRAASRAIAGTRCCSTSAWRQRSTPSTRITRRPDRERHRRAAPAPPPAGVPASPSSSSTLPRAALLPRPARAAARGARRPRRDRRRGSGRRASARAIASARRGSRACRARRSP